MSADRGKFEFVPAVAGFCLGMILLQNQNHLSQYPQGCADRNAIELYLKLRARDFGLRSFHLTAEGFRVLGTTYIHCLPEAGE